MRVLVVGAGAVGGYFGARLAQAGRDVTFLVRPARREKLRKTGLVVKSTNGDFTITPQLVTSDQIGLPYDLVILSCKAYDLDNAMDSVAPAVGPATAILPLLNGMAHLDKLTTRFGAEKVLGGFCNIGVTLGTEGEVIEFNKMCVLSFGERDGAQSPRVAAITDLMAPANFTSRASAIIVQEMWEKWIFLSSLAGLTCLMRAAIGDIAQAGGADVALSFLAEVQAVATREGHPARPEELEKIRQRLTDPQSILTASMMRDAEAKGRVEVDQILGDLIRRGEGLDLPLLKLAHLNLKAYQARLAREQA